MCFIKEVHCLVDPYATENEAVPSENEAFRWAAKIVTLMVVAERPAGATRKRETRLPLSK